MSLIESIEAYGIRLLTEKEVYARKKLHCRRFNGMWFSADDKIEYVWTYDSLRENIINDDLYIAVRDIVLQQKNDTLGEFAPLPAVAPQNHKRYISRGQERVASAMMQIYTKAAADVATVAAPAPALFASASALFASASALLFASASALFSSSSASADALFAAASYAAAISFLLLLVFLPLLHHLFVSKTPVLRDQNSPNDILSTF